MCYLSIILDEGICSYTSTLHLLCMWSCLYNHFVIAMRLIIEINYIGRLCTSSIMLSLLMDLMGYLIWEWHSLLYALLAPSILLPATLRGKIWAAMAPIPLHLLGFQCLVVVGHVLVVVVNVRMTLFCNCTWIICDLGLKHFYGV